MPELPKLARDNRMFLGRRALARRRSRDPPVPRRRLRAADRQQHRPDRLHPRRVAGLLSGLEIVDPPGLTDAAGWAPGIAAPSSQPVTRLLAAVARVP
jgi:hypothetical protein